MKRLLALDEGTKEFGAASQALSTKHEECLDRLFLTFNSQLLRGALIEAFYLSALKGEAGADPWVLLGKPRRELTLASCIVRQAPDNAVRLARAKHVTQEQERVFGQLSDPIAACAAADVPEPQMLQYQIAEILYRRASAQPAAATHAGTTANEAAQ